MPGIIFLLALLVIIFIVLLSSIKVVNTGYLYVVERLGQFHKILEPGWHFIIPGVDFVRKKVSTKQQILDVQPQSVITKDNVKISVDNVIFYKMINAKDAVYNIEDYKAGIVYSATTNIRNILGNMTLDEVLAGRDSINQQLLGIIDEVTDAYGIKVLSVEIKNIIPPDEIQQAMEKQMKADRERREKVIQAEAEKKSQVLVAEGEKESKILRAQADKESQILAAEAEKQSMILRADAVKEQKILEAEGEAQAIDMVQKAIAESIVKLNAANPNEQVIQLKSLEAFAKAADGKATKIIIPSEIQGIAGLATGLKEVMTDVKKPQ